MANRLTATTVALPLRERAARWFSRTDWVRVEAAPPHPTRFVERSALPSPARGEGAITALKLRCASDPSSQILRAAGHGGVPHLVALLVEHERGVGRRQEP